MDPITHSLEEEETKYHKSTFCHEMKGIVNYVYEYNMYPTWAKLPHFQLLSKDVISSFCTVAGTVLDPYRTAGFECLDKNEVIGDSNDGFLEVDCTGTNDRSWTMYNCQSAQVAYQYASETSDNYEMLASWWTSKCCINEGTEDPVYSPTSEERYEYFWNLMQPFREVHSKNMVFIQGVMGIISTIASIIFIWMILRSHDGLSSTMHRVLLGLCIADVIFSSQLVSFGSLVPKEIAYWSWNARGNMTTCQISGMLSFFGAMLGPWYNASLCVLLLAIVKYEKTDDFIRAKLEPFLHGVPLVVASGLITFRSVVGSINPGGMGGCVTGGYDPPHCRGAEDGFVIKGLFEVPCGRGRASSGLLQYGLWMLVLFIPPIIMATCLTIIYRAVTKKEQKMARYGAVSTLRRMNCTPEAPPQGTNVSPSPSSLWLTFKETLLSRIPLLKKCGNSDKKNCKRKKLSKSRQVMYKGMAYSCSWLLTWVVFVANNIHMNYFQEKKESFLLLYYFNSTFTPLQGVYNLAIFMLPRVLAAKRSKHGSLTWRQAFMKAFWSKGLNKKRRRGKSSSRHPPAHGTE